jgi:S1-C subfamily serine protease
MTFTVRAALLFAIPLLIGCRDHEPLLASVQRTVYEVRPAVVRVRAYATARFVIDPAAIGTAHDRIVRRGLAEPQDWPARPIEVDTGAGGSGSGFAVHPDGIILTSGHVISLVRDPAAVQRELARNGAAAALLARYPIDSLRALERMSALEPLIAMLAQAGSLRQIRTWREIELSNGQTVPFSIVDFSPSLGNLGDDVAILRIAAHDLPTVPLGDSDSVRIQDGVLVFGYPSVASSTDETIGGWLSQETDLEATVNRGSITAVRKNIANVPVFQTDIPLYPGTSGGPVTDHRGRAIGLVTWGHASADSIRFIVPINVAAVRLRKLQLRLEESGSFTPRYHAALDAIEGGRWREAQTQLERAEQAFSGNPDVARLRRDIRGRLVSIPWWRETTVVTVASAVFLLLAMTLLFASLRGRRPLRVVRAQPTEPEAARGSEESSLTGKLTFLNGPRAGERIGLAGSGIRIGREQSECEVVIPDPRISRLHAEVLRSGGRVLLVDRNSSNGTWVEGRRVAHHELRDGDIINFGGRNAIAVAFHR